MKHDRDQANEPPVADGKVRRAYGDRAVALIPTATVQTHAANLAVLPSGQLACVWFGGTQEGVSDISVWMSRLDGGRDEWSKPVQLSDDPARSEQNPILFTAACGDVWLLYTAQVAGRQDEAEVRRRVSQDGGETWSEPTTIFPADDSGGIFVRQPPIVSADGALLVPVFRCVPELGHDWVGNVDTSSVMRSVDSGETWTEIPVPSSTGAVHMNVHVVASDRSLLALYRSRWADSIYSSRSSDHGVTWSAPIPTTLPNNNSSVQWIPLADGRLAVVYNHVRAQADTERRLGLYDEIDEYGIVEVSRREAALEARPAEGGGRRAFWGTPRAPMNLAVSHNRGVSWIPCMTLDDGSGYSMSNNSRDGINRELSYPTIVQTSDGVIHVAYTYWRQAIKYQRFNPSDLSCQSELTDE